MDKNCRQMADFGQDLSTGSEFWTRPVDRQIANFGQDLSTDNGFWARPVDR